MTRHQEIRMPSSTSLFATVLLVASATSAHAVPVAFSQSSYTTYAQANAGGAIDGPYFDMSPSPLPFSVSSSASGSGGDFSNSVAFDDAQFLTTNAQASSAGSAAFGTATSTFVGNFDAQPGMLNLMLDFDSASGQSDTAFANGILTATLKVNGVTLFSKVLTDTDSFDSDFTLANGGTGLFVVSLTSTTYAFNGGFSNNAATANFALNAAPVPEPSEAMLMLAGLVGIGMWRARQAR
jgi:hypothetical protein